MGQGAQAASYTGAGDGLPVSKVRWRMISQNNSVFSAPARPYSLMGGVSCRVWHDRKQLHIKAWEDSEGLEAMSRELSKLLADVMAVTGLARGRVGVGGFSQGGHMALHWVYGQGEEVGACFALSSFLCEGTKVLEDVKRVNIPLFMSSGTKDTLVDESWTRSTKDRLERAGAEVEYLVKEGLEHQMEEGQLDRLFQWLAGKLK